VSATQQRILAALDATGPDQVNCLGQPTSPARYFTDLILLSYLIRRSWPLARDLAPSPALIWRAVTSSGRTCSSAL
jgi:hypothetical protein